MMGLLEFTLLLTAAGGGPPLKPISSAEMCGRCHRAIVEAWKGSAHSRSMESRLFQDALEAAENDYGAGIRATCLSCHAPLASASGDMALQQKVSWEGVTCDYCHSIREVGFDAVNPKAKIEFSLVKSGPLKDASSTAHPTLFSAVHTSSRVCAPCHEYRNPLGFPVLTTYSEWQASRFAKEGKTCQSCHMYQVAGDVVDPRIQRSRTARINLHQMPGSRSLEQLTRTLKGRLLTSREGDRLNVSVIVTNQAAGHYVPTGSPQRQIIMEVQASTDGGQNYREERAYRRVVADAAGVPLRQEHQAFAGGAKVLSDTRLAPDETRTEKFVFPVPPGERARVRTTFWYYYSPMARTESGQRITFLTLNALSP